jgi:hypothetical protein
VNVEIISSGPLGWFFPWIQVISWHPYADHHSAEESASPLLIFVTLSPWSSASQLLVALASSDFHVLSSQFMETAELHLVLLLVLGPENSPGSKPDNHRAHPVYFQSLRNHLYWLMSSGCCFFLFVWVVLFVLGTSSFLVTCLIQMLVFASGQMCWPVSELFSQYIEAASCLWFVLCLVLYMYFLLIIPQPLLLLLSLV